MPTIELNDTTLYYERTGQGPAMLFVHGMCGDAEVWADQARRFSDRYSCVRYDRRGHTRSLRGDATITDALHADDAACLIDALGLAPCLVVGSSGGAAIAVEVALRYGDLLRGVVLSEPPLFSLDPAAGQAVMGALKPRLEQAMALGGSRAAVDAFFSFVCPGLWSIIDEERKSRYRGNADIGFTDLRSPSLDVSPPDLSAVTVPALVIAGDSSHAALRSVAYRLAAAIADARFVELEDCGHVTYAEQPDAFAHAVSVFAADLDRHTAIPSDQNGGTPMTGGISGAGPADRFHVQSPDGTALAVWVEGDGPPLVLVHGSLQDHTISAALVDDLRSDVSTFSMDRRGFGASGDATRYSIDREFEDVAAVVDAVAERTGAPVTLWGHSYGASCAMGGAALTNNVDHLILYEPSLGLIYPPGSIETVELALAAGDRDAAIVLVFETILEMTEEEVDAMRSSPLWPSRLATAPTVPRECRAEQDWNYQPGQFVGITAPTLLLSGSISPPILKQATDAAAAAIPSAQVRVLEGHGHVAHRTDPATVAGIIRAFVSSSECRRTDSPSISPWSSDNDHQIADPRSRAARTRDAAIHPRSVGSEIAVGVQEPAHDRVENGGDAS